MGSEFGSLGITLPSLNVWNKYTKKGFYILAMKWGGKRDFNKRKPRRRQRWMLVIVLWIMALKGTKVQHRQAWLTKYQSFD